MASPAELAVHEPMKVNRKKKLGGQQKREELEREVSMLRKMLEHEQKVHEILDRAHNRHDASTLSITNYLPPKAKELLSELAMVDDEIARLERQIAKLEANLNEEKEATKEYKSKQSPLVAAGNNARPGNSSPLPSFTAANKGASQRMMTFETKALHFISKAIKGDYNLSNFSINGNLKKSRVLFDHKENGFHEEVGFAEKIPKKSGLLRPYSSPLHEPRHPTPAPKRERFAKVSPELPPKPLTNAVQSEEESINKLAPNKLSERIMKCLVFIFVRLLRTSRAMELEKSGLISRSVNFSSSSRSFSVDSISSSKASPMQQKEARQQDPYGIFDLEESIPRDIGPYKNLVIFTSSSLEPKFISNPSSIPLLQKLRVLMNGLQTVDLRFLSDQQKLAFWINMYNACIMHGFLQYGVPSSPEKLVKLMNKATLNVGGNTINAQAMEHFILRKPSPSILREIHWKGESEDKEEMIRQRYGLDSSDPNVTFALCCGTRSSPAVKIYTAETVVSELEKSKLDYLQASIMVKSTKKIGFPELLLRNMHDFAQDVDSLVQWLCHQLPTSGRLRKSMVDCFRGLTTSAKLSSVVEKIPYDFEFQYLLSV